MDPSTSTGLLGGLSAAAFVRRHWQKRPLLVRQAWPGVQPPLTRAALFDLAGRDGVESRLITRFDGGWRLRQGPLARRALPPIGKPGWTLLLQGLDLHCQAAHRMLQHFRFVPDARLDDLMISYASDGGGVGAHWDAYDVFLLQVHGRRRWRVGPTRDRRLIDGLPVKILRHFEPDREWLLEPGDMLYLPPMWGHDGVAEGDDCMTCSVGFRAPSRTELARDLLQRLADGLEAPERGDAIYRDPGSAATPMPGRVPAELLAFAGAAVTRTLSDPVALSRALGELLSEPKPQVWFDAGAPRPSRPAALALDRRSRMLYDERHVFINGEAFRAAGRDAALMRRLADERRLGASDVARLSGAARALLDDWVEAGWVAVEAGESA